MLIRLLALISFVHSFVAADVKFIAPAGGAKVTAGAAIQIKLGESGTSTPITDLAGYTIYLMVGGNTVATSATISTSPPAIAGNLATSTSITFTVDPTSGPPNDNAYYFQITSAPASGTGTVINYSNRFTISGMTGKWPSTAIQQAYTAAAGTLNSVPATVNTIATTPNANNPAAPGAVVDGPFSVSYQFQTTGLTRFAPMQQRPGTVITQTNTSPLFPTSLFTVAAEYLPTPSIITTVTQSMTISATSLVNTASSAPMPSNDMQKYLARWKD